MQAVTNTKVCAQPLETNTFANMACMSNICVLTLKPARETTMSPYKLPIWFMNMASPLSRELQMRWLVVNGTTSFSSPL